MRTRRAEDARPSRAQGSPRATPRDGLGAVFCSDGERSLRLGRRRCSGPSWLCRVTSSMSVRLPLAFCPRLLTPELWRVGLLFPASFAGGPASARASAASGRGSPSPGLGEQAPGTLGSARSLPPSVGEQPDAAPSCPRSAEQPSIPADRRADPRGRPSHGLRGAGAFLPRNPSSQTPSSTLQIAEDE